MEDIKTMLSNIIGTYVNKEQTDELIKSICTDEVINCILKSADINYIINTIGIHRILSHIDEYDIVDHYGVNRILCEIDKEDAVEFYDIPNEPEITDTYDEYSPIDLINQACYRINGSECYDKEEAKKMIASEIDFYM